MTTPNLPTVAMSGGGIQLNTLDDAMAYCAMIVKSKLAPSNFDTVEKVFVAIQLGHELGLSPMQSLASVAVVNGRPSLYGDALPALVNASGKCEYTRERMEGTGDDTTAICETKRKDQSEPVVRRFGIAAAKRAGLWGKSGPWTQYPQRMLAMRARAWAFRDAYADVMRGIAVAEDVQDVPARTVVHQPAATDAFLLEASDAEYTTTETGEINASETPIQEASK